MIADAAVCEEVHIQDFQSVPKVGQMKTKFKYKGMLQNYIVSRAYIQKHLIADDVPLKSNDVPMKSNDIPMKFQ
jgi:hypothetical protein